jgi:hypothetical protein
MKNMEWIGWAATATFAVSYLYKDPVVLRRWQGGAALLWMSYGFVIHSAPIVVANIIVAGLALGSALLSRRRKLEAPASATPASSARGTTAES